jgi:hypothetical protein
MLILLLLCILLVYVFPFLEMELLRIQKFVQNRLLVPIFVIDELHDFALLLF